MSPTPTVTNLGQRVKAKFPGQYDDLSDDELGRRVKTKFPGQYDDFADTPATSDSSKQPSGYNPQLSGPWTGKADTPLSPAEQAVTAPLRYFASGMTRAGKGAADVAGANPPDIDPNTGKPESRGSQVVGGLGDVALGAGQVALPFAAPAAIAHPYAAITSGITAAGAGLGVEQAMQSGGAQPGYTRGASVAAGAAGGYLGNLGFNWANYPNASRTLNDIFRPGPNDPAFKEITPEAFEDIKSYGGPPSKYRGQQVGLQNLPGADVPLVENEHLRPGGMTDRAINTLQQGMDAWEQYGASRGAMVDGNAIVRARYDAIPETMKLEKPAEVARLMNEVNNAYGGKQFTMAQARQFLREKNAGTTGFWGKSGAGQSAAGTAGTPAAVEVAEADAIRDAMYQAMDPQNNGAGPREINRRTGQVIEIRNSADRIDNRVSREKPKKPAQVLGLQQARGAMGAMHGDPSGLGMIGHPIQGPTDAMISDLYNQTPQAKPIPMPPSAGPQAQPAPGPTPGTGTGSPPTGGIVPGAGAPRLGGGQPPPTYPPPPLADPKTPPTYPPQGLPGQQQPPAARIQGPINVNPAATQQQLNRLGNWNSPPQESTPPPRPPIQRVQGTATKAEYDALQQYIRDAGNLGFNRTSEAVDAIALNPDWASRWDVQDPEFIRLGNKVAMWPTAVEDSIASRIGKAIVRWSPGAQ